MGAVLSLVMALGCVHSHHMTLVSDFSPPASIDEARLVESEARLPVVFGVAKDTQYAVDAYRDLQAECPEGTVTGIQTRYSTALGFFRWENHIQMWGYCFD